MRIRQIKPEFFVDDQLAELCSRDTRLLFIGLWLIADRKGRLEERAARIKAQLFPYDSDITVKKITEMLSSLASGSFIFRYSNGKRKLIQIRSFEKHQHCHIKEPDSHLPGPDETDSSPEKPGASTVQEPCLNGCSPSASGLRLLDNGFLSTASGGVGEDQVKRKSSNGTFGLFWVAYPRKIGKGEAEKCWNKINPTLELVNTILLAIELQRKSDQWVKDNGQYIPNPSTWLNQRRWQDEPTQAVQADFFDTGRTHGKSIG